MKLTDVLNIERNSIVSIAGAGGKTTLMFQLAEELKDKGRVLITTTTKIYMPKEDQYDYLVIGAEQETIISQGKILDEKLRILDEGFGKTDKKFSKEQVNEKSSWLSKVKNIKNGIWIYGEHINEENKLTAVDDDKLGEIIKVFDYILIEGDGSKGKPLKGWRDDEPVISKFTTCTIGVLDGQILGMDINEDNIHRASKFLGKSEGTVSEEDLIEVIFNPKGLFNNSKGSKAIFVNKSDDEKTYRRNCSLMSKIISKNLKLHLLNTVIIGSLREKKYYSMDLGHKMVSGIIMASGLSRRMGQCKLLMNYEGRPIIDRVMEAVEKSSLNPKIAVTGNYEIMNLALKRNLSVVVNEKGELGQSESIKLGVLNSKEADGYAFIAGDQPFISTGFLSELIEEFEKHVDKIIIPVYKGTRGNPVIFPKRFKEELLSLKGDVGGRVLLNKYKEYIQFIEVKDEKLLQDIDTNEEYERLISEEKIDY